MNTNERTKPGYLNYVAALIATLALTTIANAATITVPGDFATIQGAINAAADGDTILVSDGTYTETIDINVPNLQVLSVNGRNSTTIEDSPGAGNPIVTISAPGATFGDAGQGFTVEHLDANASYIVFIDSPNVGYPNVNNANPLSIVANRFLGNQVSQGVYSDGALAELTVNINDNIFGSGGGAYAFSSAMYFNDTSYCQISLMSRIRRRPSRSFLRL